MLGTPDTARQDDWASWARVVISTLDNHGSQIEKIFGLIHSSQMEERDSLSTCQAELRSEIGALRGEFLKAITDQCRTFSESLDRTRSSLEAALASAVKDSSSQLKENGTDIAVLKRELQIKAGIWGGGASVVVVVIAILIEFLKRKLG